jgi:hypothetical protein
MTTQCKDNKATNVKGDEDTQTINVNNEENILALKQK